MLRAAGLSCLLLIVLLSIIPGDLQVRTSASKGFEHAVAYLLLGLVLTAAYRNHRRAPLLIAVLLSVMSGLLEVVQHWCPGRTPLLMDWLSGAFGSIIGVSAFVALRQWWGTVLNGRHRNQMPKKSSIPIDAAGPESSIAGGTNRVERHLHGDRIVSEV
jgi:VanZ family protein